MILPCECEDFEDAALGQGGLIRRGEGRAGDRGVIGGFGKLGLRVPE